MTRVILAAILLTLAFAGPASAQLTTLGVGSSQGGGSSGPTGCTGAVDLSAGCALPMLHGAP